MSGVTKREDAGTYFVSSADGMDWARIFLASGTRSGYHWGDISFISTFGSRGHHFSSISAGPFERWVTSCSWDYLAGKFWGTGTEVFDYDGSIKKLKAIVLEKRRGDWITQRKASECWEEITALEHPHNKDAFLSQLLHGCGTLTSLVDLADIPQFPAMRSNPQCEGFRDSIWKPFCQYVAEQHARAA